MRSVLVSMRKRCFSFLWFLSTILNNMIRRRCPNWLFILISQTLYGYMTQTHTHTHGHTNTYTHTGSTQWVKENFLQSDLCVVVMVSSSSLCILLSHIIYRFSQIHRMLFGSLRYIHLKLSFAAMVFVLMKRINYLWICCVCVHGDASVCVLSQYNE